MSTLASKIVERKIGKYIIFRKKQILSFITYLRCDTESQFLKRRRKRILRRQNMVKDRRKIQRWQSLVGNGKD